MLAARAGQPSDYVAEEALLATFELSQRSQWTAWNTERAALRESLVQLQAASKRRVYTVQPGKPGSMRIHRRGSVTDLGEVVTPGGVAALRTLDADFGLAADAAEMDREWVAKVVSVEGTVQSKRARETEWASVHLNDTFLVGDLIRVRELSRAAVLLRNETVLRLDQETTITFAGVESEETFLLKVISGSVHFFSRTPKKLKVITPFVNAAVGGTEFTVRVEADRTSVSVLEGKVTTSNEVGSVALEGDQSAMARAGKAPEMRVVVRPRVAVQWAIYYPPILD